MRSTGILPVILNHGRDAHAGETPYGVTRSGPSALPLPPDQQRTDGLGTFSLGCRLGGLGGRGGEVHLGGLLGAGGGLEERLSLNARPLREERAPEGLDVGVSFFRGAYTISLYVVLTNSSFWPSPFKSAAL